MDNNGWRAAHGQMAQGQGGAAEASAMPNAANAVAATAMDNVGWRTQLHADSRRMIVNKIMDTLKRHLPSSGPEGQQEIERIAARFEEKVYTDATSQPDYLRTISLKMRTMETKVTKSHG